MSMLSGLNQSDDILQQLIQAKRGQAKPAPGAPDPYSDTPAIPPGAANQPTMIGSSPAMWSGPAGEAKPSPRGAGPYSETTPTPPGQNKRQTMMGSQPVWGVPRDEAKGAGRGPVERAFGGEGPEVPPVMDMQLGGSPTGYLPKAPVPVPSFQPGTATPHGTYGANAAFPARNAMSDDDFKTLLEATRERPTPAAPGAPPPTPKGATAIQPSGMTDVPLAQAPALKSAQLPEIINGNSASNGIWRPTTFSNPADVVAKEGVLGGGMTRVTPEWLASQQAPFSEDYLRMTNNPAMRNPSLGWSDEQRKNSLMSYLGMGKMGTEQTTAQAAMTHAQATMKEAEAKAKATEYSTSGIGDYRSYSASRRQATPGISEQEILRDYLDEKEQLRPAPPAGSSVPPVPPGENPKPPKLPKNTSSVYQSLPSADLRETVNKVFPAGTKPTTETLGQLATALMTKHPDWVNANQEKFLGLLKEFHPGDELRNWLQGTPGGNFASNVMHFLTGQNPSSIGEHWRSATGAGKSSEDINKDKLREQLRALGMDPFEEGGKGFRGGMTGNPGPAVLNYLTGQGSLFGSHR